MMREPKPKNAFHQSSWSYLDVGQYARCCRTTYLQCNRAMHDDRKVSFDLVAGRHQEWAVFAVFATYNNTHNMSHMISYYHMISDRRLDG